MDKRKESQKELLNSDDIAQYFVWTRKTAEKKLRSGRIPRAFKEGKRWYVRRKDIEEWVQGLSGGNVGQ